MFRVVTAIWLRKVLVTICRFIASSCFLVLSCTSYVCMYAGKVPNGMPLQYVRTCASVFFRISVVWISLMNLVLESRALCTTYLRINTLL